MQHPLMFRYSECRHKYAQQSLHHQIGVFRVDQECWGIASLRRRCLQVVESSLPNRVNMSLWRPTPAYHVGMVPRFQLSTGLVKPINRTSTACQNPLVRADLNSTVQLRNGSHGVAARQAFDHLPLPPHLSPMSGMPSCRPAASWVVAIEQEPWSKRHTTTTY